MKKILLLCILFVGLIVNVEAADKLTLVSTSWTCYTISNNGKIKEISDLQQGLAIFTFEENTVRISIDKKVWVYDITQMKHSNDTYVGTKIYCDNGTYINVYISKTSYETELLISKDNSVIIFNIVDL
jgi:hypothetical protein